MMAYYWVEVMAVPTAAMKDDWWVAKWVGPMDEMTVAQWV